MTKATEIKLEDDRGESKDGLRDKRRGMKLVPIRRAIGGGRSFNIGVAENLFSPRGGVVSPDEKKLTAGTNHINRRDRELPEARIIALVGVFIIAGVLGFLVGRSRD